MKKPIILNQANVYTLTAVLYTIRNYLPIPSIISRAIFVLFFFLSGYYLIRTIAEYSRYPIVKALLILVFLSGVYGFLLILFPPDETWVRDCSPAQFINDFYDSLLPVFAFIYLSRKGIVNDKWLIGWTFLFVVAAGIKYVGMQNDTIVAIMEGDEDIRRNAGYSMLALIPCIPFLKKYNVLKYILWVLVLMSVLFSVKRGAILLSTVAFLIFLWKEVRSSHRNRKIIVFLLLGVALVVLFNYVQRLLETYDMFNYRLSATLEGEQNDRNMIFINYLNFFLNESNIITLIFGHGAYATLHYLGLMAHNDWLELAIDIGLLGVVVYLVYWIGVWKMIGKSKKVCPEEVHMALLLFAVLYLGKSFISMSIMSIPVFAAAPFGYSIGQYYNLQSR